MANIGITLAADATGLQRTLNGAAGSIEEFSRRSGGSLKQVATEASSLQNGMDSFANGLKSALVGSSIAVGLIGLRNSLTELKDALVATQVQADKMRNGLSFAVGKTAAAAEMDFVRKSAQDLGLELVTTSGQYTRLAAAARGTTLAGQGVRDIFTAMGQAGTVMGLSAQEMDGALMAVTQMISKSKVQAEELRGQLGERLPGAFQTAARAMGVTTSELDKMLETGKVLSTDFLPKFAAQLSKEVAPQVEDAAKSMQASLNRLENSWTSLKRAVNDGGMAKAIQNEVTGLSNYMQAVADAASNAKAAGGGALSQTNAALGNVLGRMPFDAVALTANSLNTALNALSGGALKLRTDFNLLPDVFLTNEQRLKNLSAALPAAETNLAKLQARLAMAPNNIYLKDEVYQLSVFIAKARAAKEASDQLKGLGKEDPTAAGIKASGMARESFMAEQKQSAEDMLKVKQKLSGVDADYLPTLAKLQRARELGTLTEQEYIATVSQLASANFKRAAAEKVQSDTAVQDLRARIATERQYIQALQDVGLEADKANEGEKLTAKLTQELTGKLDAKTRASKEAQLVEAKTLAIEISKRDAIKDTLTAREKSLQAAAKEYADRAGDIDKINDRAAAIEIEVASNESLAKAVELVGIARLRERRDILKGFDGSQETIALIEKEIAARERLVTAMDSKESSDSLKKAAKDAEAEWARASNEINRSITDALMRAFEDGSGFAQAFSKVVEAEFKTLVLRPVVSAVMSPISQGINGVLGGLGVPGVGAPGAASSGLSGLSNLYAGGGLFATNAAYGAAIGTTSIGAGSQAAMLAAQTGAFGSAGASMTAAAAGQSMASSLMSGAAAAGPYVLAAMVLKSAMDYSVQSKGNALTATIGSTGTQYVGTRADFEQTGGLFGGGTTQNSDWGRADQKVTDYVNANVAAITAANLAYGQSLGLATAGIESFVGMLDVSITGLDAAAQTAALDAALVKFGTEQASAAYGTAVASLAKTGETTATTVQRLATDLASVNATFSTLGYTLLDVSMAGASAADRLVNAFGGLQNFQAQTAGAYQNFYTEAEKKTTTASSAAASLQGVGVYADAGVLAGATREDWRAMLDQYAAQRGTEAGDKQYAAVVQAANALNSYIPAFKTALVEAAATPAAAAASAYAADPVVADAALSSWQEATAAIVKAMADLRTTLVDSGPDSFFKLQAQFAIEAASAKAGNVAAAQDLPALAKSLVDAGKAWNVTTVAQSLLTARVVETLGSVAGASGAGANISVPHFAAGGYHKGGWAVVGENGRELVNMPPARVFNAGDTAAMLGTDPAVLAELRAMRAELAAIKAFTSSGASSAQKTAKVLDEAANGVPLATQAV